MPLRRLSDTRLQRAFDRISGQIISAIVHAQLR
jgi:hypothetical protein